MKRKLNNNNNNESHNELIEEENNEIIHDCDSCDEIDNEEIIPEAPPLKKVQTDKQSKLKPKQTSITDFFSPTTIKKTSKNDKVSPFFSNAIDTSTTTNSNNKNVNKKTTTTNVKKNNDKDDEDKEDENEEEDDDEEDDDDKKTKKSNKKLATTTTYKKKSSPKKKVNPTENKFSTINYKDDEYKQKEEYSSSKKDKLENVKIGGHVSIKTGYPSLIQSVVAQGFKAVAFFTNPPRTWKHHTVKLDDSIKFKQSCKTHNFDVNCILPHGSYFLNLGSPNKENLQKSRDLMIHEMKNCEILGVKHFNFHPGSHLNEISEAESIKIVAESLDYILERTKDVVAVIECTAGQGTNLGYTFEHLRDMIALVKDKSRVGVCLDTCHMFAAGYNISSKSNCDVIFEEFDKVVGFKYLKGVHLNDSKSTCGSKLDRHENIGKGHIGTPCFKYLVNDKRFQNVPMILETVGPYDQEVKLLYSFIEDDVKK
ncbi:hypothetical protein RB653_005576 [Dictyostelium firmibasis]|uniref:Xylose isomerase-like TIM barrel domain-containing protein n=1 Tax=Dictyostelium firmibasis TaxID=79012 RepID=A0AAN7Z4H0_9MYCE